MILWGRLWGSLQKWVADNYGEAYRPGDALRTVQQSLRDSFERSRLRPACPARAKAVRRRSLRTRGIVRGTGETPGANRETSRSEKGRCAQEARSAAVEGHEKGYATKGI